MNVTRKYLSFHAAVIVRWQRGKAGFSLIEVTIAMAIASMGIVTLLGLLPVGLNQFHGAMNASVSARIAQRLIHEATQTDYGVLIEESTSTAAKSADSGSSASGLQPINKGWRYFDDQGVELPEEEAENAIYHALTRIVPATELPASEVPVVNSSLATITIQVAINPANREIEIIDSGAKNSLAGMIDPSTGITFSSYTGHIAKAK